jgi:hypothetical protein
MILRKILIREALRHRREAFETLVVHRAKVAGKLLIIPKIRQKNAHFVEMD